jgi:hypothetical protein
MFDSDLRLMALNSGSRKIKDVHEKEKSALMNAQVVGRDFISHRYLIYHHSWLFGLWIYTKTSGCPRAYPLVFSCQALVTNSNSFVTNADPGLG